MVRITNGMMVRRYMGNLNTSLGLLSESTQKISSGKKYSRLSESPLDVSRSMRLEEDLYKNTQNVKVLEEAKSELASAESNLMDVIDVLTTCYERAIKAGNGTTSEVDRAIIADEMDSYINFMIQSMNSSFNDKFLFSNTNNNTEDEPFKIAEDGTITFNNVNVDEIFKDENGDYCYYMKDDDGNIIYDQGAQLEDGNGNLQFSDGTNVYFEDSTTPGQYLDETGAVADPQPDPATLQADFEQIPQKVVVEESFKRYADVGLGMTFNEDGSIKTTTVLEISFGGLDALGFGLDDNGLPNNVLSVLVQLRDECGKGDGEFDFEKFGDVADQLIKVKDNCNFYISKIGTRSNYIEKSITRLDDEEYNLQSLKEMLVEIDSAEEIIAMKQYEFSWNAILQMGSKLIPTSLMDYI